MGFVGLFADFYFLVLILVYMHSIMFIDKKIGSFCGTAHLIVEALGLQQLIFSILLYSS